MLLKDNFQRLLRQGNDEDGNEGHYLYEGSLSWVFFSIYAQNCAKLKGAHGILS